jgi:hypothetical protein
LYPQLNFLQSSHIHALASQYEESAGPLAQIYAERTDITAEERAIDARVNTAREQSLPMPQWKRCGPVLRAVASRSSPARCPCSRSASAAREIKELIGASSDGERQVDAAGTTISNIVEASWRVTHIMEAMHQACRAQTQQIGEVTWRDRDP